MIELLRKLVRGQTNLIGEPVRNLIGPAPQYVTTSPTSQEQRWLLLQAAGNDIMSVEDFFSAFAEQEQRERQFLVASNGMATFMGRRNTTYLLRAVAVVQATETVPLTVVTAGSSDQFAVFVDGVQRARGAGERQVTLALTQGRHLIEMLIDSNSFGVHLPPYISLVAQDDNLSPPSWAFVKAAYVDPVMGVLGIQLGWNTDARCGGWIVHRRDLESHGLVVRVGELQEGGIFALTAIDDDSAGGPTDYAKNFPVGAAVYAGFEQLGVITSINYDPDETYVYNSVTHNGVVGLTVRLRSDYTELRQEWVGRDLNSGVFREVARVHRSGAGSVVTWVDTGVALNNGYEYALQSYGMFDPTILSPRSSTMYVRAGDDDPPGPITFLEDYPYVINGRVVVKCLTPDDGDYAGVRVFYRDVLQEGTSPNAAGTAANSSLQFILEDAPNISVVGYNILFTSGPNQGEVVQIIRATSGDTTGQVFDYAPSLSTPPGNDTYQLFTYKGVVTDYGLPSTQDEFSFTRESDEEGLPKYGVYYFVTFDHTRNQQAFEDAAVWEYTSSDELCDAPLPPDISIKQLNSGDLEAMYQLYVDSGGILGLPGPNDLGYLDPTVWAIVELGATDACDGKRGVIIEYSRRERWDGQSTGDPQTGTNQIDTLWDTNRTDIAFYPASGVGYTSAVPTVNDMLIDTASTWDTLADDFFFTHRGVVLINPDSANLAAGLYPWWDKRWIASAQYPTTMHHIVRNDTTSLGVSPPFVLPATMATQPYLPAGTTYKIAYRQTPDDPDDDPWNENELRNYIVQIDNGMGEDQEALIVANDDVHLELSPIQAPGAYYVGRGTPDKVSSGDLQPTMPDWVKQYDIVLMVLTQRDNVVATVDAAWTPIFGVDNGGAMRASAWWARKDHGVPIDTLITRAAGNAGIAQLFVFRGCVRSGTPFLEPVNTALSSSSFIITYPETTSCPVGSLAVLLGFTGDDGYALFPKSTTNTLDLVEQYDSNTNLGNDAGLVVLTSELFTGNTGQYTSQYSSAQNHIGATLVLQSFLDQSATAAWDPDLIPNTTSVYHIAWVSALAANAPLRLDDTSDFQRRGRLIAINKQENDNFIVVRARDKDNNLSPEYTYAPDYDTLPEFSSVISRIAPDPLVKDKWRVYVVAVADDDTQSAQWWVYPQQPSTSNEEVPWEGKKATIHDLSSKKSFSFDFPFGLYDPVDPTDVDRRVLFLRPFSQTGCQGIAGVDWSEELIRYPTTTVFVEPRDERGRLTRTKSRLTFKVSPRIREEPTRDNAAVTQDSQGPTYDDLRDFQGNFGVDTDGVGDYAWRNLGEPAFNWYFVEMLTGTAANKLRQIVSNTGDQLKVTPAWNVIPGPTSINGQAVYPRVGDFYRIWKGTTYWRLLVETRTTTGVSIGVVSDWAATNNPEVIDRSQFDPTTQELVIQFYSVITGVPKEPVKSIRIDPDDVAEISQWDARFESDNCHLRVEVTEWDDDAVIWEVYARRGQWPVYEIKTPGGSVWDPDRGILHPDFLRHSQWLHIENDISMEVTTEAGTWYVIVVPYNTFSEAGARVYKSVVQTADCTTVVPPDPGTSSLRNLAIYQEQVSVSPGVYRYVHRLTWEHTDDIEAAPAGQFVVTVSARRADLPASYTRTVVTGRDPRLDATNLDVNLWTNDSNSITTVGSIYHPIDLGWGSDRALSWWVAPMVVPPNQSTTRYTWNYTVDLTDTVTSTTRTYTLIYPDGWYLTTGTGNPTGTTSISNLTLALEDSGVCTTSNLGLGQVARAAMPGVSYRLTWDVSNPDNAQYYVATWIAIMQNNTPPTAMDYQLQGAYNVPGFPYQILSCDSTTCVIGTSGDGAYVEAAQQAPSTGGSVVDEVLIPSGSLVVLISGSGYLTTSYPCAHGNIRNVVVKQNGNTFVYGGAGSDYAYNAVDGTFWFWTGTGPDGGGPNFQSTFPAGPDITVSYDWGDPAPQSGGTGGGYYQADRTVWAKVQLMQRDLVSGSPWSMPTEVQVLETSISSYLGICGTTYLNIP